MKISVLKLVLLAVMTVIMGQHMSKGLKPKIKSASRLGENQC